MKSDCERSAPLPPREAPSRCARSTSGTAGKGAPARFSPCRRQEDSESSLSSPWVGKVQERGFGRCSRARPGCSSVAVAGPAEAGAAREAPTRNGHGYDCENDTKI